MPDQPRRSIVDVEILSIGSELTVGETRDTNAGELAMALTELGIHVGRIQALPDDLAIVTEAFTMALGRADLVVSTGGLGPTPDDLTRESIAAAVGETPAVDAALEAWLRALWARRDLPFAEINLKQAWLLPSATAIPNDQGTAPGWWVEAGDSRIVVALPGPPREMRPMWKDTVVPRLRARGAGRDVARVTLRLIGIGESQVADLLGDALLRAPNPQVATYARADAVDVRISASANGDVPAGHPGATPAAATPTEMVAAAEATVRAAVGEHVWATGATTWAEAIDAALATHDWTLATAEVGTRGTLTTLLGEVERLSFAECFATDPHEPDDDAATTEGVGRPTDAVHDLGSLAERVRAVGKADVGLAVRIAARGDDTAVSTAVAMPDGVHRERRLAFLGGSQGRSRAALTAAAILLDRLRAANVGVGAGAAVDRT